MAAAAAAERRQKKSFFRSVAQMKVQVMAINSVQFSSNLELSSGTFGQFKVCGSQVLAGHMVQVAKY